MEDDAFAALVRALQTRVALASLSVEAPVVGVEANRERDARIAAGVRVVVISRPGNHGKLSADPPVSVTREQAQRLLKIVGVQWDGPRKLAPGWQ